MFGRSTESRKGLAGSAARNVGDLFESSAFCSHAPLKMDRPASASVLETRLRT